MTYIKVPQSKGGNDHCSCSLVFPIAAVEDERRARVLSKSRFYGFQKLIKYLKEAAAKREIMYITLLHLQDTGNNMEMPHLNKVFLVLSHVLH